MRRAWNWLLAHAHATRVTLLVVLILGGTVWGWYLWKNGGYTENAPPTPQFMEVYVGSSANSAAASVVSVVVPVTAWGKHGKGCAIENTGCDEAVEYVTTQIKPQPQPQGVQDLPVQWLMVVDTPPVGDARQWSEARVVEPKKAQTVGYPSKEVWYHLGTVDPGEPVTFTAQFHVHPVARPSDHLVIEMPAVVNEANPASWCGPEISFSLEPAQIMPAAADNNYCMAAPGQPGFDISTVFTGPPSFYAPESVTSTEALDDSGQLHGFTLDSSDDATPIAAGFEWTGSYQLQPDIYATNIASSGLIARRQLLLGVLIGLALAALLGLVQEFRHEKKEPRETAPE